MTKTNFVWACWLSVYESKDEQIRSQEDHGHSQQIKLNNVTVSVSLCLKNSLSLLVKFHHTDDFFHKAYKINMNCVNPCWYGNDFNLIDLLLYSYPTMSKLALKSLINFELRQRSQPCVRIQTFWEQCRRILTKITD